MMKHHPSSQSTSKAPKDKTRGKPTLLRPVADASPRPMSPKQAVSADRSRDKTLREATEAPTPPPEQRKSKRKEPVLPAIRLPEKGGEQAASPKKNATKLWDKGVAVLASSTADVGRRKGLIDSLSEARAHAYSQLKDGDTFRTYPFGSVKLQGTPLVVGELQWSAWGQEGLHGVDDPATLAQTLRDEVEWLLRESGQLAMLATHPDPAFEYHVTLDYYHLRELSEAGFHKDTQGNTLFVNLAFANETPILGPEWIVDMGPKDDPHLWPHEAKLPAWYAKRLAKERRQWRKELTRATAAVDRDSKELLAQQQEAERRWDTYDALRSTPLAKEESAEQRKAALASKEDAFSRAVLRTFRAHTKLGETTRLANELRNSSLKIRGKELPTYGAVCMNDSLDIHSTPSVESRSGNPAHPLLRPTFGLHVDAIGKPANPALQTPMSSDPTTDRPRSNSARLKDPTKQTLVRDTKEAKRSFLRLDVQAVAKPSSVTISTSNPTALQ